MTPSNLPKSSSCSNWITYTSNNTAGPIWISDFIQPGILPKPLRQEVDTLFDHFVRNLPEQVVFEDTKLPKCNAWTDHIGLCLDFAVPYHKKDDLFIDVDTRLRKVTVEGNTANGNDDDPAVGAEYIKREISKTSFKRTFLVGQEFDLNAMKAEHSDGLLKLRIPYSEDEKSRFKQISID